jgi:molybdenum ABC transporter molybdate-binding protein
LASFLRSKRLAIANPDRDLAGTYGLAWLREIGTGGEGDKNVIVAESSAGVLTLLADNMAQLGIVYASDAAVPSDLAVMMPLPEQSHPAIDYVAAEAMDPQSDTKPFFDFLGSGQAKAILPAAGLQVASE